MGPNPNMRHAITANITIPTDWRLAANGDKWHCNQCGGSKFTEHLHHQRAITEDGDSAASLELAFSVAEYFGLNPAEAREVATEVGTVTNCWRAEAATFGVAASEIDSMASAFEHDDLALALRAS